MRTSCLKKCRVSAIMSACISTGIILPPWQMMMQAYFLSSLVKVHWALHYKRSFYQPLWLIHELKQIYIFENLIDRHWWKNASYKVWTKSHQAIHEEKSFQSFHYAGQYWRGNLFIKWTDIYVRMFHTKLGQNPFRHSSVVLSNFLLWWPTCALFGGGMFCKIDSY